MPDISKLSGTLIDSVGKVDGVLKGDIASIVGLTVPSGTAYTPPLDTYTGATAAYSVRKLSSSYSGSCIEAYRVSDGATQDIGFDGDGLIDTAAIISFGGSSVVEVSRWYDQSGNALDGATSTNANTSRPRIYDGSSVFTVDGKPCVQFVRTGGLTGYGLVTPSAAWSTAGDMAFFAVFEDSTDNQGDQFTWNASHGSSVRSFAFLTPANDVVTIYGTSTIQLVGTSPTGQQLTSYNHDGADAVLYANGASIASSSTAPDHRTGSQNAGIGMRSSENEGHANVLLQEIVHYPVNQTSTRTGIEVNLNDFYQIANLPASSSGLLYDYPDAAAAYSVRSLSNNAIKCMRVRRTVSPFDEQDIGFDSNGDLDTAAIATFGGSDPLTVSAWYDQSGNNNRATQVAGSSQPQIYDGSAVITENGKPAMFMNGLTPGGDFLVSAGFGTGDTRYFSYVARMTQNSGGGSFSYHSPVMFMQNAPTTGGNFLQVYTANASNSINVNYPTAALDMSSTTATNVQHLLSLQKTSTDTEFWIDGTSQDTATGTQNLEDQLSIGRFADYGFAVMHFQELVVWNTDQDGLGNRSGIETDINTYYSIY